VQPRRFLIAPTLAHLAGKYVGANEFARNATDSSSVARRGMGASLRLDKTQGSLCRFGSDIDFDIDFDVVCDVVCDVVLNRGAVAFWYRVVGAHAGASGLARHSPQGGIFGPG